MCAHHNKPRALVNLLDDLPEDLSVEHFAEVCQLAGGAVRIERIVSHGQASPEDFWYDQDEDEWILILQGEARLHVEQFEEPVHLTPGDSLLLPAHCRHRITWTTPDAPTIWLAVFTQE
ncbi:MAG: cupin domain-containing protein [Verrucomicrobia bacterium]|nr:cupin domain-containing protein [Verrucomicrobiota bacterium]MDA1006535.1 cupin domain-containing protein [Verrucomicrobiota bacterium]